MFCVLEEQRTPKIKVDKNYSILKKFSYAEKVCILTDYQYNAGLYNYFLQLMAHTTNINKIKEILNIFNPSRYHNDIRRVSIYKTISYSSINHIGIILFVLYRYTCNIYISKFCIHLFLVFILT